MFTDLQLKNILIGNKILSEKEFTEVEKNAVKRNKLIENYLFEEKIINLDSLYDAAAKYFNVPFVSLKDKVIRKDILGMIPEPLAFAHKVVSFDATDKEISIALEDPSDIQTIEFIKKKTGLEPKVHLSQPDSIDEALKSYHKSLKAEIGEIHDGKLLESQGDLKKMATDLPIVRVVDTLLEYAIYEEASDIHIEPEEKDVLVRYRIDGILNTVMTLPKELQAGIIARIKVLSNLKVDEHRLPQDGRFKITTADYKISFRVSIIPTFDGEKIVLRLLNEKSQALTLEQLGLQTRCLELVKANVSKPQGMILVTGPTGSGKTTTLYTVLSILNRPEVNISTIEDPIEYRMPHVNQSQVNPKIGFTFAMGLRAFLRQDPNIIMVGEIRDSETAEIAVHAAMTGHLVLSTLHTNDAITTLPRLAEMGIPNFLLASTVNIIIAQRLVRKICANCIQSYNLTKESIADIEKQLNVKNILDTLEKEKIIADAKKGLASMLFYRGKGCTKCKNTGYKGRIGIYETFEINNEISNLLLKKADLSVIQEAAKKQGMISMVEDGFIKAKNGITSLEEVLRVTKE